MVSGPIPFAEYPFTSHFHHLPAGRMHYVDEGQASDALSVVMVHGNPTWSYYYRHLISALSPDRRVLAADHLGMGLSETPEEKQYKFRLQERIDDLDHWLKARQVGRFVLVVHDWGGMIGIGTALRHLDSLAGLVILNTAAFGLPPRAQVPWQLHLARTPMLGAALVRGGNAFVRGTVKTCSVKPLPDAVKKAYLSPYDSYATRLAVHRFVQDIPLSPGHPSHATVQDVERHLGELADVPAVIYWGLQDFVFTEPYLRHWQEVLPHAEVHEYKDASHLVLEDKRDEIIQGVKAFIAGLETPAST